MNEDENNQNSGSANDPDEEKGAGGGVELTNQEFLGAVSGEAAGSFVVTNDNEDDHVATKSDPRNVGVKMGGETTLTQDHIDINDVLQQMKPASAPVFHDARIEDAEKLASSDGSAEHWSSMGARRVRFAAGGSDINDDERRGIVATPLESNMGKPMGMGERFFKNFRSAADDINDWGQESPEENVDDKIDQMYRLQATRTRDVGFIKKFFLFVYSIVNCGALTDSSSEQNLSFMGLPNPNRWLIDFFYWLFRSGWTTVMTISLLMFYGLVLFFTLLIFWAARIDSDCVRVGGLEFGALPTRSRFYDSFALSWHTFSTVGYGSAYPALSTEHDHMEDKRCTFIAFITSVEALVGVIFAGFVGAIIFAKVTRITQRARVKFSDPLLVKYGEGVESYSGLDSDESPAEDDMKEIADQASSGPDDRSHHVKAKFQKLARKAARSNAFPVLEFRIANELNETVGGEIIDANVNAVVILESNESNDEVSNDLARQIELNRKKRAAKEAGAKMRKSAAMKTVNTVPQATRSDSTRSVESVDSTSTSDETASMRSTKNKNTLSASTILQGLNPLVSSVQNTLGLQKMKIDEETSSSIVPRMVFSKLELDNSEHPFFKRCWTFRHTIDQNSPLLSNAARDTIMENGNKWPLEWNNPESIRKAIHFNQIVVSFTGVSNISAASVYRQKVYDYVDYVIGYQFVNPLFRGRHGKLKVDLNIINDVIEQNGGGGETLNVID
mmetsp:Transcript_16060/g.32083  ORF Transcript_16060/g.32083 Transcript_16060/m.32083 type:complete len:729 (+) Transcript_16060:122-2308(+)